MIELGVRSEDGLAKCQASCAVPYQRSKNVSFPQRQPGSHAQGFLTAPEENSAMDLAHAIKTREFVIEHAGEKHKLICFDIGITPGGNLVNRALVEQTLNHAADFSAHNPLLANVSLRR